MVKQLTTISENVENLELSDGLGSYAEVNLEFTKDLVCCIHMKFYRWSHNVFKQFKIDHVEILDNFIKPRGINKIIASYIDLENKIWPKFIKLFGFPKPQKIMISVLEI